ncbi:MAG: ABC transporter substrate-binding protein, partial [Actinobacteria bacterium]|nr:ABC transporter substrate-binding protein [Actinomycetota bacterium]
MPPRGTSQVASSPSTNVSPRRKGGSSGESRRANLLRSTRRFFVVRLRLAGIVLLAFALAGPAAAAVPHRIVSLSPTATEDLFAIGAGKQVVAVDSDSDYPKNAPHTKLSAYTPNAEAIAGYNPDLVVISNDQNGIVAALHKLKVPVLLQPAASGLGQAYAEIEQLGTVTGHAAQAKSVVARMRAQIAAAVKSVASSRGKLTVYHELEQDYYSATSKTFIGGIYKLLGLRDIADAAPDAGSGYPKLSAEYIVAANPDLIVLADTVCCGQTAAKVAKRTGWENISAVKNG